MTGLSRIVAAIALISMAIVAFASSVSAAPTLPATTALSASAPLAATPVPAKPSVAPKPAQSATAAAPTTPTNTPPPTHTSTPTATATPLPPTPTKSAITPEPSGYFAPVYQGQIQAPGLNTSVIRGQVVDYRGEGIPDFPVSCSTNGVSYSTVTGPDGVYAMGGLQPSAYTVEIKGYPAAAAQAIPVPPGNIVSVDFVESAPPDRATPTPDPSQQAENSRARQAVVVVVITPENSTSLQPATPTATPTPNTTPVTEDLLPVGNWAQSFLTGVGAALFVAAMAVMIALWRR